MPDPLLASITIHRADRAADRRRAEDCDAATSRALRLLALPVYPWLPPSRVGAPRRTPPRSD
ncbi:hypothetical protein [Muricoccus radiodurans]|uniref:hypothetical protein n=1 Tax=Muricoccus radiodurans TaxID=2231721 RepID=UPI003CF65712